MFDIVPLTLDHLKRLPIPKGVNPRAYFVPGSVAMCVLDCGLPVFAGGIVNLQWNRGEAWVIPTPWMRSHLHAATRLMREFIPFMADSYGFDRVQATCVSGLSNRLFRHLGFNFEATLKKFGPAGETCDIFALFPETK